MKKILIAVLLLIPLIVVLTINMSATIVSAEIKIDVSQIVLTHEGESVEYVKIILSEYLENNRRYTLTPIVYPAEATNAAVEWSSSDPSIATVEKMPGSNFASVSFYEGKYGSVTITARSKSNIGVSASCTFFIVDTKAYSMEFREFGSDESFTSLSMLQNEVRAVYGYVVPEQALQDKKVVWASENEEIATVDQNGVITAHAPGSTDIVAYVMEEERKVQSELRVTVDEQEALCAYSTIYTTEDYVDVSAYVAPSTKILDEEGNELDRTHIPADSHIVAEAEGIRQTICVVQVVHNGLVIESLHDLERSIWKDGRMIVVGQANVQLVAKPAFGSETPTVTWTSSDTSVLTVDENGLLRGVGVGTATLTASAEGYADAVLELRVNHLIDDFQLITDEDGDKRGIGQERWFGIYTCQDGVVTNTLPVLFRSTNELLTGADPWQHFFFSVDRTDVASVSEQGVLTFSREAIDQEVTLTVRAKNTPSPVVASYTFHLVDGINIGYGKQVIYTPATETEEEVLPDMSVYEDFIYVANTYDHDRVEWGTNSSIVFHSNVYLPESGSVPILLRPIYGNGFIYDGQFHTNDFDTHMFQTWLRHDHIRNLKEYKETGKYDYFIDNLTIQSYRPVSDDSEEAFIELKKRGGTPLRIDHANDGVDEIVGMTVTLRHCLFQYAYCHVQPAVCNLILEGCVFRNSAAPAILTQSYPGINRRPDITFRNCIFSNTISPALLSTVADVTDSVENKNKAQFAAFRFEGENYIYNWKQLDEVNLDIFPSISGDYAAAVEQLSARISSLFREVMADPANHHLLYVRADGEQYVNFSFVLMGGWVDTKPVLNPKEDFEVYMDGLAIFGKEESLELEWIDMSVAHNTLLEDPSTKLLYGIIGKETFNIDLMENPFYFLNLLDENGNYNTQPGETYELDENTIARLHGLA